MAVKPVTLKDVAQKAGVSITTVSHVINKTRYVSPSATESVEEAIKELNYVHNLAARTLKKRKSNVIGIMMSGMSNPFFLEILQGIESVLKEKGYLMILGNAGDQLTDQEKQINVFSSWGVDGIITYGQGYQMIREKYDMSNCPIVCIETPGGDAVDSVIMDARQVVYESITDMIKSGYREIGCIYGIADAVTTIERIEGYKEALRDNKITVREEYIRCGDSTLAGGYRETNWFLDNTGLKALFVGNNMMTLGCTKALSEREIDIPSRLALLGYDDDPWRDTAQVPISSIRPPLYEMGKKATQLLLRRINNPEKKYEVIKLFPELIKRKSY